MVAGIVLHASLHRDARNSAENLSNACLRPARTGYLLMFLPLAYVSRRLEANNSSAA
jgi:hypothetical protein